MGMNLAKDLSGAFDKTLTADDFGELNVLVV
jgi:hypothetical protein